MGTPKIAILSLTHGVNTPPNWDSKLLLMREFPVLFNSDCWLAKCGDICAVISLYCFYVFSFNDCILKSNNLI